MTLLAIDPGLEKSGMVVLEAGRVVASGLCENGDLLEIVKHGCQASTLAIEMIDSYGMPVGKEVFRTLIWVGRFMQAWPRPDEVRLIERRQIKLALCGTARAKDSNVRQALIDRLGPPGIKRAPGPTYGVTGHMWAALGVAVVAQERAAAGLIRGDATKRPAPRPRDLFAAAE